MGRDYIFHRPLSNKKWDCENYLFEDYRWKSGITTQILTLKSTRKESSLSKEKFVLLPNLSLSPTSLQSEMTLRIDDYW